jgi:hypothetical protein
MEQTEITVLLEKYWRAETTVEEERVLTAYFRQGEIPADLEPVRGLFAWREEEAELKPGADFDRRMLVRIEEMEDADRLGVREVRGRVIGRFSIRFAAAAAIILCLGIGLLIPMISRVPEHPVAATAITDTYTDPNQALAAVRRALVVASVRMNEGKHITQKNITRLHDSWQAATGD